MLSPNRKEIKTALEILKPFIPSNQLKCTSTLMWSEEGEFYQNKILELAGIVSSMPVTYGQDGKGDEAICYLRYFGPNFECYVTEKDMEDEQVQMMGYSAWNGNEPQLGYIHLPEIIRHPLCNIDYHYKPTTIGEILKKFEAA